MGTVPGKKSLSELLSHCQCVHIAGPPPHQKVVASVTTDSRHVQSSSLFIALRGEKLDGHDFVQEVLDKGCTAILMESDRVDHINLTSDNVTIIGVQDSRSAYGYIAAAFFDTPQKELKLVGVTGTNGKTTVTYLLESILRQQGAKVGVIGTVNYRYADQNDKQHLFNAPLTTPDPMLLQQMLRQMKDSGVDTVLMEASSHALVQKRLTGIEFDVAAFTNLSHDHLDYHRTMEDYFAAKALLFAEHVKKGGKAVVTYKLGQDEKQHIWPKAIAGLLRKSGIHCSKCGQTADSIVSARNITIQKDRTEFSLHTPNGEFFVVSPLVGTFNVENVLTAVTITADLGYDIAAAAKTVETIKSVPGRLERVLPPKGHKADKVVYVDYAHTPDALYNVLSTLADTPHKRLICVFGCGGDRDKSKRPLMGELAARFVDVAVVTDDNPRSESSAAIIDDIMAGIDAAGMPQKTLAWLRRQSGERGCVVIPDRSEAIGLAVKSATEADIVVIAGKGHEKYQLTNDGKRFFDDTFEVQEAMVDWDGCEVARALHLSTGPYDEKPFLREVCTDSRNIEPGQIFVALQGDHFNGHDYLDQVVKAGAGAVIIHEDRKVQAGQELLVYQVEDTLQALGELAAFRRKKMETITRPVVVGITGSCGKTTVKEMVAEILSCRFPDDQYTPAAKVLKTVGNFNNLVGLPLSLLPLSLKHRAAVLEMGMNQPGEIQRLTKIADPDICCIVNVHGAHLEGLGSIENVAKAKEEMFASCRPVSTLVVNLDNAYVAEAGMRYDQSKVHFTKDPEKVEKAEVWGSDIGQNEQGNVVFTLHVQGKQYPVCLQVAGEHNVENCLAAAAIAQAAGVTGEQIVQGLEAFTPADKRLQILKAAGRFTIINDTYNANPASMAAGLATLASVARGQKIAILGDMLELGSESITAHRELGRKAAQSGLAFLLVVGSFAEHTAGGAAAEGMQRDTIFIFQGRNDIVAWVKEMVAAARIDQHSWLLVKGSRGMKLEEVVERLVGG